MNPEVSTETEAELHQIGSPKGNSDSEAPSTSPDATDQSSQINSPTSSPINAKNKSSTSNPDSNRRRVLSLDRGQDAMAKTISNGDNDDDDNSTVTSDGESSYFAKNMPSPKSGRLSFASDTGSISSAPARAIGSRESDASLSFSDDEEEDNGQIPTQSSLLPPSLPREEMQFKGITRIHSVSSLVSEDEHAPNEATEAELQHFVRRFSPLGSDRPHNNPGYSFIPTSSPTLSSPQPLHASPPPIASQQMQFSGSAIHPQPLSADQMQVWKSEGLSTLPVARTAAGEDNLPQSMTSAESKGSQATLNFVYSEDEEFDEGNERVTVGLSGSGGVGSGGVFRGGRGSSISGLDDPDAGHNEDITQERHLQAGRGGSTAVRGIQASSLDNIDDPSAAQDSKQVKRKGDFKVYHARWIMLFYMSLLNLLSDWTCYSVAPIATLTQEAFGSIDPEQLVTIFLAANAVASACEPIILSRLGLRKTVVFGALLLMIGSIIKSGGIPLIMESNLEKGQGEWRVYLGFFLVGLSQPLYQCTPALLSASWFPERERTMATGVALNANQLGIGFAFVFGTVLVGTSDDIIPYFGLLSLISTLAFLGSLIQFDDAPPTPPSDTARVIRGTMEWNLPDKATNIWQSVKKFGKSGSSKAGEANVLAGTSTKTSKSTPSPSSTIASTRRRTGASRSHALHDDSPFRAAQAPSSAPPSLRNGPRSTLLDPSPMMPGPVNPDDHEDRDPFDDMEYAENQNMPPVPEYQGAPPYISYPMATGQPYPLQPLSDQMGNYQQQQYWAQQQVQQHVSYQQYAPPQAYGVTYQEGVAHFQPNPHYYMSQYPTQYPPHYPPQYPFHHQHQALEALEAYPPTYIEEYAEPTLTITDHHLDINIRDDQVLLSIRACFSRPGFVHALVTFTVSGIVVNTLSTFMDYLVQLNGAGREYVGIVGGSFQFVIMMSSLIIGKQTDNSRAYYSVTIAMLVFGAFALAECGVSLDADRGGDLRWALIVVAALVGPLQPVSTELGVEVAYPLSENTVLVIQQLFSNLLSALFIPFFKALRDVGTERYDSSELYERPQYTFSFYLLIVLHAAVTVFFATFNGRYLRYEHELAKKNKNEQERNEAMQFDHVDQEELYRNQHDNNLGEGNFASESHPLLST
eukprot:CAMPEP_0194214880 /NCGR_PEP_ID=MMETSP0156-20130528/16272_1 /TAXON_ID=33649 /ORGANISM="Thalassionema nitzschioides, Strain L26-B" /LENGTH=1143 /DNA_ID=CAMNT_0038943235 /DNA_START=349 /DNA_END=3780 /DNA_ORIENTATION=+